MSNQHHIRGSRHAHSPLNRADPIVRSGEIHDATAIRVAAGASQMLCQCCSSELSMPGTITNCIPTDTDHFIIFRHPEVVAQLVLEALGPTT